MGPEQRDKFIDLGRNVLGINAFFHGWNYDRQDPTRSRLIRGISECLIEGLLPASRRLERELNYVETPYSLAANFRDGATWAITCLAPSIVFTLTQNEDLSIGAFFAIRLISNTLIHYEISNTLKKSANNQDESFHLH